MKKPNTEYSENISNSRSIPNPSSTRSPNEKASQILEKYRRAGEIAKEAKKIAHSLAKPGTSILQLCERIESFIRKKGGKPAFPVNVSVDTVAAHYTAYPLDTATIPKSSIVKIDLGVHIDGYIVDTAISVWFSPKLDDLAKASRDALEQVIDHIKPGVKLSTLGGLAQKTIESYGFTPIKNLYGHQIKRYVLHAGLSIPSTNERSWVGVDRQLEAGRIYAIEPFATTGTQGIVSDGLDVNIFQFLSVPDRDGSLLQKAISFYRAVGPLPFSPRWLNSSSPRESEKIMKIIHSLTKRKILMKYPALVDIDGGIVSQFEHTVRVTRSGVEILT